MDLGLNEKVALVTASSRGLGFAVAKELAQEGASLIMCGRDAGALSDACLKIADATGAEPLGVPADLYLRGDIERLVRSGIERFGRIDILVTNSGGPKPGKFESLSPEDWGRAVQGLLDSVIELSRLVLPGMKERGWGRILCVTSIAAKQPVKDLMLSNSVRAAVTGFAKTLASETAIYGVTVNSIMPGYTATERVVDLAAELAEKDATGADEVMSRWEEEIPMRRLGRPDEFAALAAFLVSDRASYITGASIPVDGGWIRSTF